MTTLLQVLAAALLGGLGWSATEYLMHRFRGHGPKNGSLVQEEHRRHHAISGYSTPLPRKVRMASGPLLALLLASSALLGLVLGVALTAGYAVTYAGYEHTHWRLHHRPPRGPWGRFLRRHHFAHHFHDATGNHGVTSPLWDLLFGTYRPVSSVRVPARYVMPWLLEAGTGRPDPRFAGEYRILEPKRRRGSREGKAASVHVASAAGVSPRVRVGT